MEKDLTCVGCSRICAPPDRIYQCNADGEHVLCHECACADGVAGKKRKRESCPECGAKVPEVPCRNKALEKLARKQYGLTAHA